MKKIISIMLAVLMIFASMAVCAGATYIDPEEGTEYATECTCADHFGADENKGPCTCCLNCDNKKAGLITSCVTKVYIKDENGNVVKDENGNDMFYYEVCCRECTGIWPCDCGCSCCDEHDENYGDKNDSVLDEYWGEEEQEEFVDIFQSILKKISDAFDAFFDAIFEFLRIDEVLGRE